MKTILNTVAAYFSGWGIGLLFGFYDSQGLILYDYGAALRSGVLFACSFAIATLWAELFNKND